MKKNSNVQSYSRNRKHLKNTYYQKYIVLKQIKFKNKSLNKQDEDIFLNSLLIDYRGIEAALI